MGRGVFPWNVKRETCNVKLQTTQPRRILETGIRELGLSLETPQVEQLLDYLALLQQWNRAYNLTAVTDPAEMVGLHLLDSLAVLPHLSGGAFIDVGTGAGLPGIPLAIASPDRQFTLLDSNGKRVRFLFQVRVALGLGNVTEIQSRAEEFEPERRFDGVISRAFTSLLQMVEKTRHLLAAEGKFYAMKGRYPEKELRELAKDYTVSACHHLEVPGIGGERHLVEIGLSPVGTAH